MYDSEECRLLGYGKSVLTSQETHYIPATVPSHFLLCTAVIMKNAVFWDIESLFIPHMKHIISPLQRPAIQYCVRFAISAAVTMKNAVLWDIKPS
jgi:hypothetical protein